jgi:hypothetical protein
LSFIFWVTAIECSAANSGQVEVIQLTKAEDIKEVSAMRVAVDVINKKVMECSQSKQALASECFCLYPGELSEVRRIFEETIRKHPNWKDKVVSYYQNSSFNTISLRGVGRQLERRCQDSK